MSLVPTKWKTREIAVELADGAAELRDGAVVAFPFV